MRNTLLSSGLLIIGAALQTATAQPPASATAGTRPPRQPSAAQLHPGPTQCATAADFLAYHDLSCAQTGGLPLPKTTDAQREHNKELVLRFYQGDMSVLADQFIQHDPAEPSTKAAWNKFFSYRMRAGGSTKKPELGGPMGYGKVPVDQGGSPVEYLVAEGDIVVAMRFRWWPWEDGPEPIYKGLFVDVWRVDHDQLVEQWCTATPADASPRGIDMAKQEGSWVKFKNMNEQ